MQTLVNVKFFSDVNTSSKSINSAIDWPELFVDEYINSLIGTATRSFMHTYFQPGPTFSSKY